MGKSPCVRQCHHVARPTLPSHAPSPPPLPSYYVAPPGIPADAFPAAPDRAYTTLEGVPLVVGAASGLLSGASSRSGGNLTALLESGPSDGAVSIQADGAFTYTPAAGFSGSDAFAFRVVDSNGGSAVARANITIGGSSCGVLLCPMDTRLLGFSEAGCRVRSPRITICHLTHARTTICHLTKQRGRPACTLVLTVYLSNRSHPTARPRPGPANNAPQLVGGIPNITTTRNTVLFITPASLDAFVRDPEGGALLISAASQPASAAPPPLPSRRPRRVAAGFKASLNASGNGTLALIPAFQSVGRGAFNLTVQNNAGAALSIGPIPVEITSERPGRGVGSAFVFP